MPINKTPEELMFPLRSTGEETPKVERYGELPTATSVKANRLFGIPLRSSLTNEELPDSVIENYISGAVAELEQSLDIYITPVKFREKHDYDKHPFFWSYGYLTLDHPNVLAVEEVQLSFTNDPDVEGFVKFPLEHVHVMPQEGLIQLVPAYGTSLSGFLLSAFSGTQFHALRAIGLQHFPGGIRVTYTAGFNHDKIPANIVELLEIQAALKTLSALGPLIFPANSTSISIDGVSQSVGTPGPQFLAGRIKDLQDEYQKKFDIAQGYFQRKFIIDYI
jgi:hypothetical protein